MSRPDAAVRFPVGRRRAAPYGPGMTQQEIDVRRMRPEEHDTVRGLSVGAFGGDAHIATLIDALRASWAWDDETSFVAERGGSLVGQVLYTHALLDAPRELVDVLV